MKAKNYMTDTVLIATPGMEDDRFSQSVVYIYEHDDMGAMGLVINKPMDTDLGALMAHLDIEIAAKQVENQPVYTGGPMGPEHGFILHTDHKPVAKTSGNHSNGSITISATKEALKTIAEGKGPREYIVVLGYASWDAGQLEDEVTRNDWLVAPFTRDIMFKTPAELRWNAAAKNLGFDINLLSREVGHA